MTYTRPFDSMTVMHDRIEDLLKMEGSNLPSLFSTYNDVTGEFDTFVIDTENVEDRQKLLKIKDKEAPYALST